MVARRLDLVWFFGVCNWSLTWVCVCVCVCALISRLSRGFSFLWHLWARIRRENDAKRMEKTWCYFKNKSRTFCATLFLNHIWCASISSVALSEAELCWICGPHFIYFKWKRLNFERNAKAIKWVEWEEKKEDVTKTREDKYNSKMHCSIVVCIGTWLCGVLNCIALLCCALLCCVQHRHSDRHLFFIWFAIKK